MSERQERPAQLGMLIFALSMVALGVQLIVRGAPVLGLEPTAAPDGLLARVVWVYLPAAILLGGGVALAVRWRQPGAAALVTLLLLSWLLALHVPRLWAKPRDGNEWAVAFETLALLAPAWLSASRGSRSRWAVPGIFLAPPLFALCLVAFGIFHFIYWRYIASVTPHWIPGSPVFWAYATGGAHIAGGVGILTRIYARLAATMTALMFGLWVLMVHIPRVARDAHNADEWTSLFICAGCCGAAWLLAGRFVPRRRR